MKANILPLLLFALAGSIDAATPKNEPPIPIEQAIEKARDYVKSEKIDVSQKHISSAKFEQGVEQPFWFIIWELDANRKTEVKTVGGQVFVKVYLDSKIEVTYGE